MFSGFCVLISLQACLAEESGKYGYFARENSSYILIQGLEWNVGQGGQQTEFSFRTCDSGQLLFQNASSGDSLKLLIVNGSMEFHWSILNNQSYVTVGEDLNNNQWWTVTIQRYLGDIYLNISQGGKVEHYAKLSNSTFRSYFSSINLSGSVGLYVGQDFTGCLLEGPNVLFLNNPALLSNYVSWSNTSCPQIHSACPSGK